MTEIYISVDVETDGPIPGPNSMLSIGAAAFLEDRRLIGTFSRNLHTLDGSAPDPLTMQWWSTQPEAWKACRQDTQPPRLAVDDFLAWVKEVCAREGQAAYKPVFVGYPAGFDFLFVYWYLIKLAGQSPFSFSALDIKTLAMSVIGCGYREVSKKAMAAYLEPGLKHTHVSVEDAIEQGYLFLNLLRVSRQQRAAKEAG